MTSPWAVNPLDFLILPGGAGPNDGAIILDPNPPGCLASRYDAVIVWRPTLPSFRGQFFIGVTEVVLLPSGTTTWIEYGFMLDDPDTGVCWIYVTGRWSSDFDPIGGNSFRYEIGNLFTSVGSPAPNVFNFDVTGRTQLNTDDISGADKTIRFKTVVALTNNNAAFANFGGASVSFNKRVTQTAIQVTIHSTGYANGGGAGVEYGVLINGVDYPICQLEEANPMGTPFHCQVSGTDKVAIGLAAGTYTVQVRWRRTTGAGTLQFDANDLMSCEIREVDSTN